MTLTASPFEQKNHLIVKDLVSEEICKLLYDYVTFKTSLKPQKTKKDDPLSGIHREYGDLLMETLLNQLTPAIEKATGLSLWPTLSFYYTYKNGNVLTPHKDRSSCEYVAGLYIGADEAYKKNEDGWPIIVDNQAVSLETGDIVIFKGHQTTHWREPFTGEAYVCAIFAYVDKNGPFAFQKYDQRKQLGKPHVGMFNWMFGCMKARLSRLWPWPNKFKT
jgi:hypothetical protein